MRGEQAGPRPIRETRGGRREGRGRFVAAGQQARGSVHGRRPVQGGVGWPRGMGRPRCVWSLLQQRQCSLLSGARMDWRVDMCTCRAATRRRRSVWCKGHDPRRASPVSVMGVIRCKYALSRFSTGGEVVSAVLCRSLTGLRSHLVLLHFLILCVSLTPRLFFSKKNSGEGSIRRGDKGYSRGCDPA